MNEIPTPVDPEVASETLRIHLDAFFGDRRHEDDYVLEVLDGLTAVVAIRATRFDGTVDWYTTHHDASWYDRYPTRIVFAEFVDERKAWEPARFGSKAYPLIAGSPTPIQVPGTNVQPPFQFALHSDYPYPGDSPRQLVCFSHSFDYYITGHGPTENQRWSQGKHTISATLTRLHTVLQAPTYLGPSDAHCS